MGHRNLALSPASIWEISGLYERGLLGTRVSSPCSGLPWPSNVSDAHVCGKRGVLTGNVRGILGYGAIGRQCANLARALGMDVVAFTMRERPSPESRKDDSYCVPGTGDPDGLIPTRWFHGTTKEVLNNFLAQDLDILVICLPLTASTRNMISKEQFDILAKKKTFVTNVGRGGHINTEHLIEALEQGLIRGAAVDVTNPEPLPKSHPLWKAPNLLITPHVSWVSSDYWRRILQILEHNLEALSRGTPFVNMVNKELHY